MNNNLPPAAWYPDPNDASQLRYWDGQRWTDDFAPRPPAAPPVPVDATPAVTETRVERVVETATTVFSGVGSFVARRRERRAVFSQSNGQPPDLAQLVRSAQLEQPRLPLDEQVEVAGETYYAKSIKQVFADHGMPITDHGTTIDETMCILVPEPWNPHDSNAVAVMIGPHQVGHLPAELAADYAASLGLLAARNVLATGQARIWAKSDGGIVRARVTVLIPEAHAFG